MGKSGSRISSRTWASQASRTGTCGDDVGVSMRRSGVVAGRRRSGRSVELDVRFAHEALPLLALLAEEGANCSGVFGLACRSAVRSFSATSGSASAAFSASLRLPRSAAACRCAGTRRSTRRSRSPEGVGERRHVRQGGEPATAGVGQGAERTVAHEGGGDVDVAEAELDLAGDRSFTAGAPRGRGRGSPKRPRFGRTAPALGAGPSRCRPRRRRDHLPGSRLLRQRDRPAMSCALLDGGTSTSCGTVTAWNTGTKSRVGA
jgi:hypothetical protein